MNTLHLGNVHHKDPAQLKVYLWFGFIGWLFVVSDGWVPLVGWFLFVRLCVFFFCLCTYRGNEVGRYQVLVIQPL